MLSNCLFKLECEREMVNIDGVTDATYDSLARTAWDMVVILPVDSVCPGKRLSP